MILDFVFCVHSHLSENLTKMELENGPNCWRKATVIPIFGFANNKQTKEDNNFWIESRNKMRGHGFEHLESRFPFDNWPSARFLLYKKIKLTKANGEKWDVNYLTFLRLRFWAWCWHRGSECWSPASSFWAQPPIQPVS